MSVARTDSTPTAQPLSRELVFDLPVERLAHEHSLAARNLIRAAQGGDVEVDMDLQAREAAADEFGKAIDVLGGVRVLQAVRKRSRDRQVEPDLVQDTFLDAWRGLHTFRGEVPVGVWLCSIASRCVQRHQARSVRPEVLMDQVPQRWEVAADPAETVTERIWLMESITRLPPEEREALVRRHFLDMSNTEIAEDLGTTPNAVAARISRAFARLRAERELDELIEEGYLDPRFRPSAREQEEGMKPLRGKQRQQALQDAREKRKQVLDSSSRT